MKVLVLAPSLENVGGIQRYSSILVRALRDILGPEAVRVLSLPERPRGHLGSRAEGAMAKGEFAAKALWKTASWRPSLIICTHIGLARVGWLLNKLLRRPYWTVAYGIEVWGSLPLLKKHALRRAARILVMSQFTRERLISRHGTAAQRIVVSSGVVEEHLAGTTPDREVLSRVSRNGQRLLLTVARMAQSERYKGHDVVLRSLPLVLEKAPEVSYLLAGDGDDRARLEGLARELGLQDHVQFVGSATGARLAACYHACEVFVMPAETVLDDHDPKGEGFGLVFLEAMAFGKPVVGPSYGAPAEFIRHGEHGLLVDPKDPRAVADALIQLLASPERARRMGEAGRRWVVQEFSYQRFQERLGQILNDHASDGSRDSRRVP